MDYSQRKGVTFVRKKFIFVTHATYGKIRPLNSLILSASGDFMNHEWVYIGIFIVIGIIVPIVPLVIARVISPRKANPLKQSTYECGMETVGETWVQFKAQYYIFALVFLVFDVETVFLFPWAMALDKFPIFVVFEGVLFIGILVVGLLYTWRKGLLEWA
jgi:NADH:ubiquinone oxidoreductase subunit 3 (subunit A)